MKKILLSLMIVTMISLSIVGCKRKEEQPQPAAQQQSAVPQGPIVETPMQQPMGQPGQMPPPGHGTPGAAGPKVELQAVVPQEVAAYWSGVKFIIEDKVQNRKQELTASVGGELKIPDSNLVVKVGPFLPDFKMGGDTVTSATNDLNNPAVGVAIFENGSQIFPQTGKWGWLYQKFPAIHAFQHQRFALTLKEGVKK